MTHSKPPKSRQEAPPNLDPKRALHLPIRIDEKAAKAKYDAAVGRRKLILELTNSNSDASNVDSPSTQYRIEQAERRLVQAAADLVALTSWGEAAALFALFAAEAQRKDPHQRRRGKPRKNGATALDLKIGATILTVEKHLPGMSRTRIIREMAEMAKEQKIPLPGVVPADMADLPTLEKRVKRAFEAAMKSTKGRSQT